MLNRYKLAITNIMRPEVLREQWRISVKTPSKTQTNKRTKRQTDRQT